MTGIHSALIPHLSTIPYLHCIRILCTFLCLFQSKDVYYSDDGGKTFTYLQTLDFEPTHIRIIIEEIYATGRGLVQFDPDGVVTSTKEENIPEDVLIFPNPVIGSSIRINSRAFDLYALYGLDGRLVNRGVINDGEIIIGDIPAGIYLLYVEDSKYIKQQVVKIVVY